MLLLHLQDTRPTGTIPLAGNNVIRHRDDPRQTTYKFEIVGMYNENSTLYSTSYNYT